MRIERLLTRGRNRSFRASVGQDAPTLLVVDQIRNHDLIENLLMRAYSDADLDEIRRALLVDLAPIHYYPWSGAKGCEDAA